MTDGGRGTNPEDADDGEERRYPASRLRRPEEPAGGSGVEPGLGPDIGTGLGPDTGPGLDDPLAEPVGSARPGRPGGSMFAPRSFAGGRVQVFGCSPGFLIISIVVSLVLTLLLNALL